MTRQIQRSFRELLNQTSWIDDETKELATEKVNAMLLRIGYPDFILQAELLNERYKDVRQKVGYLHPPSSGRLDNSINAVVVQTYLISGEIPGRYSPGQVLREYAEHPATFNQSGAGSPWQSCEQNPLEHCAGSRQCLLQSQQESDKSVYLSAL